MSTVKVYIDLANPYSPLTSDRLAIWLASLAAVRNGCRVRLLGDTPPESDSILVTNRKYLADFESELEIILVESTGEFLEKSVRKLGLLYGRLPVFHSQGKNPLRSALSSIAGKFIRPRINQSDPFETESEPDVIPPSREIAFRINVDWDDKGFDSLVKFLERESIPITLAVAVDEIRDNLKKIKELVRTCNVEIASHSMSHYIFLPGMSVEKQKREIIDSRKWLSDNLETEIKGFVSPYMRYDRRSLNIIERAGYGWFIRTWSLCPIPLEGSELTDLGISYYLKKNWKSDLPYSLMNGNPVFQLHLPDMHRLADEIAEMVVYLKDNGCRFVTCTEYYRKHIAKTV